MRSDLLHIMISNQFYKKLGVCAGDLLFSETSSDFTYPRTLFCMLLDRRLIVVMCRSGAHSVTLSASGRNRVLYCLQN